MHSQTLEDEFHDNTCSLEHPPKSLSPADESSSPEFEEDDTPVPDVIISSDMESDDTVIPSPDPIFNVNTPFNPPPVNPFPAVTPVTAYVPILFESRSVPVLPSSRLSSVVDINAPSKILSSEDVSVGFTPSNTFNSEAFDVTCVPERYIPAKLGESEVPRPKDVLAVFPVSPTHVVPFPTINVLSLGVIPAIADKAELEVWKLPAAEEASVNLPFESTEKTGMTVDDPYVPDTTPVFPSVNVPSFDIVASPDKFLNEGADPVIPKSSCPFVPTGIPL